MAGGAGETNHTGLGYVLPYERRDGFIVQLCDAWKEFKVSGVVLFNALRTDISSR